MVCWGMQKETIFWYDLETYGTNPQHDRIAQFAGIRTSTDLEIIDEPIILYNKITEDYLPDPQACLVTGLTPQETNQKGLPEYQFIQEILKEFLRPGTCVAGYNNIRFDDEFIRNALYRNFHDPYTREYTNGNSRWDIIDVARAAHDLRPAGIIWPKNEEGRPSFRLEVLTHANSISHEGAHDALADVHATISIARLIKKHQPELFSYAFSLRRKNVLKDKIELYNHKPFLHTAAVHTTTYGCTALVVPLAVDPRNSNSILCYDLSFDPDKLIEAAPGDLLTSDVPLTRIALNKVPFIAPAGTLTDDDAARLHIDRNQCLTNLKRILERHDLPMKLRSAMGKYTGESSSDPDFQLYSGGFFSDEDRERFQIIHRTAPNELLSLRLNFQDPRVPEMLWRYICRNFQEVLDEENRKRWKSFAAGRILFPPGDVLVNLQFFRRKIDERIMRTDISAGDKQILRKLADYADELEAALFH